MKNSKLLSEQLSFLPDNMVDEAMASAQKPHRKRAAIAIVRIAACFAVILGLVFGFPKFDPKSTSFVTGPGMLSVSVSATNAHSKQAQTQVLEEGITIPNNAILGSTNSYVGIPIHLSVSDEDHPVSQISYRLSATAGVCADNERQGYTSDWFDTITCENDSTVRWSLINDGNADWYDPQFDHCFLKIIIRCQEHIIGYSVIRFDRLNSDQWCEIHPELAPYYEKYEEPLPLDVFICTLVTSVSFPMVDGKYQKISESYVDQCMNEVCVPPAAQ